MQEDKSSVIFGNTIPEAVVKKAEKKKQSFIKKFGDDREPGYHLKISENDVIGSAMGAKVLELSEEPLKNIPLKPIIIGNIRMGFGHYRISMAMASAARALGYTPLWLDLNSFPETTCTKIISAQNKLYSLGSRLSQKSKLFNTFIWDPLNYTGFKRLSYNAGDQKNAELMTSLFCDIPKDIPYIATHVWPSQAAIHAGLTHVVNAIPDNWPMALHLSEGALHTVQTPSAYIGYRTLSGFSKNQILKPIPKEDIVYTGHYVDDDFVRNIESDCTARINRLSSGKAMRFLLSIGGAGAQADYFCELIKTLIPHIKNGSTALYVNIGDYENVWTLLKQKIPELDSLSILHFDQWKETKAFAEALLLDTGATSEKSAGIHVFCHKDIFAAVYATNLLMRTSDVLITKPSELSFYPIPKLLIQHVGRHETWGAIRAAEIGDGTPECQSVEEAQNMLELFLQNPDMVISMCRAIMAAKKAGVYNGAYHAVELAAGITGKDGTGSWYTYAGR